MNFPALIALIVLLFVAALAQQLGSFLLPFEIPGESMTLLSVAIMLIGGWLMGTVFDSINLPRICGYLVFGILISPSAYTLSLLPSPTHVKDDLRFINYVAISLIALIAGGEIHFDWIRGQLKRISLLVSTELVIILGAAFALFNFALPRLSFLSGAPAVVIISAAMLASIVVIANSPSVAIAMISDYRAKGPLSQTTLAITVAKDMVLVALFATVVVVAKTFLDANASFSPSFLAAIALQLLGSIALGSIAGFLMAVYVARVKEHLGLFIVGCCLLFALAGNEDFAVGQSQWHLEPLLMAISAGVIMQNVYPDTSRPLFHRLEELSLPVYCLFFSLAGAKVDLELMTELWYLAAGLAIIRAIVIWFATRVACSAARIQDSWRRYLWLGLIPQAGVSLVLVTLIADKFAEHHWTVPLTNLLIGMIVCNELFGPIGFRYALFRTGEAEVAREQ